MAERHGEAERRAPRWLKWINPLNRFLLRRGIGPPGQHLLTVVGRASGKPRTTPVAVITFESRAYVVAGFNGSDWVKNARAAGRGELRRGRRVDHVELVEVHADQRAAILRLFAQRVRGGQSFLTVAADAPYDAFVAAAPQHPIFRVVKIDGSGVTATGKTR
jgi:deazaflavin-dependent oxidoreductase (nitroreductase family)